MMIETTTGLPISNEILGNYFRNLVGHFFKILPMREANEGSLIVYMQSLQAELLGCKELVNIIKNDASYLTLLSILQYLIDTPECTVREVKREVFRAISICNKLRAQYLSNEVIR